MAVMMNQEFALHAMSLASSVMDLWKQIAKDVQELSNFLFLDFKKFNFKKVFIKWKVLECLW